MRVTVRRPECSKTYVFDEFDNVLNSVGGNIPTNWMASSGNINDVHFSRQEDITIGESSFYNCGLQGNLIIPDNITGIGRTAFSLTSGINDVFLNLPYSALFDGEDSVKPFYNGPVGDLYVTQENISSFGGEGADYAGMTVNLWSNYPNVP